MTDRRQTTLWILRAQVGSREALECLLKDVQGPLYRYITRLVADGSLAEDILQEVLLRIYRKLGWLRDPELFRPWCFRIATRETFRRLARDRRWAESCRDEAVLGSIEARADAPPPEPELLPRLPRMLGRVPPASRAVLSLHYVDGFTLGDTAEVLGVSLGTVKSRLAGGLAALRRQIAEEGRP